MNVARRRAGRLLPVAIAILCCACENAIVSAPETGQNLADLEAAWSWVDSLYPILEMKRIDWDGVHAQYRPLAEAAWGDEFYQILHDMLAVLEDGHLYFQTPGGGVVFPHIPRRLLRDRRSFSPYLMRNYFDRRLRLAGGETIEYEILPDNIGYIRIATFDPDYMMDDLPEVMEFVRNSTGLIIDVRNNNGGQRENVAEVVSRFIESPLTWMQGFEQDGVPFEPWPPIEPDDRHYRYDKPVVVLANGASISGGEIFPEVMKQLPLVTVVGDTTAGAGCNDRDVTPGDLVLPSGKRIHIPTGCLMRYDGIPIEWNGVLPDIRIAQTPADVEQGMDRQLEHAIELLRGDGRAVGW